MPGAVPGNGLGIGPGRTGAVLLQSDPVVEAFPPWLAALFPAGVVPYALGGLLIGLGVAVIYLGTGITAGASTFLETTLSYASRVPRFSRERHLASRDWRLTFTLGIVLGAAAYALTLGPGGWTTAVQPWRLLAGGFLVGVGTRVGKGCTSGHGVCGVGSLSGTSITNVATFLVVAAGTAQVVAALGVVP